LHHLAQRELSSVPDNYDRQINHDTRTNVRLTVQSTLGNHFGLRRRSVTSAYGEEFFADQRDGSASSADRVAPLLVELISPSSVLDVGCGLGTWLVAFRNCGVDDIHGIDGSYVRDQSPVIEDQNFTAADLSGEFDLGRTFDLVVSLEVGEHLPPQRGETFVRDLARHAPVIAFSAAVPHQGGVEHLHEEWPDVWAARFARHGYRQVDAVRPALWTDPQVEPWYAQNMFVYVREERLASYPRLAAAADVTLPQRVVHPLLFTRRVESLEARLERASRRPVRDRVRAIVDRTTDRMAWTSNP
jgi:SAM-dependent methyltransferase